LRLERIALDEALDLSMGASSFDYGNYLFRIGYSGLRLAAIRKLGFPGEEGGAHARLRFAGLGISPRHRSEADFTNSATFLSYPGYSVSLL